MDTRRALLVDAFTTEPLRGNAAGVVPDAEGLADGQLQAIARELNASGTAFILPGDDADRRVRYFTPQQEVDRCGHAAVGSHAFLADEGAIDEGSHTLETNVGVLDVEVDGTTVWMRQTPPEIREVDVEYEEAADALGLRETALSGMREDLPIARATTGLPYLMFPVEYLSDLGEMEPDTGAIADLSEAHDCAGAFVFTFDTLESESTLHARTVAPGPGVPEDPVTGTASGACGAYLDRFGAFDPTPDEMIFERGFFVDRCGHARVRASAATAEGVVQVGGEAVVSLDGELRVPPADEDEIIEA